MGYISEYSGAYAFGPKTDAAPLAKVAPTTTVNQGPLVTEAYQVWK